jgi:type I restriction enzyme S subunit
MITNNMNVTERFSGKWETKRLGDISNINPQNFSSNTNPDYKFNYISLEQVDSGRLLGYSEEVFRTAPSRAQRVLQNGDVLMSTVRPNLMAHLFFHDQVSNAVCSTGFAVLRAKRDLSTPYFLFAQLFSQSVNDQITKILAGSNYPAINSRDVKLIEIPCPPRISEQRAIAEVLSDVDGLLNALEALIAKKRAIKQAVMQQLLTGRTRLPGFSGAWETKRLGEIAKIQKGSLITEKSVMQGTVPVIAGGQKPAYFHNIANRTGKTITVSGSGAYAGFVALHNRPIFASDCSTISESPSFSIDFIYYYLVYNQNTIYKAQTGGAQPHIHPVDLMPLQVNLPPLPEQHAIATVLSDMDAEIAALEQRRDKTRAIKLGMMQQLLTGRVRLSESQIGTDDAD